MANLQTLRLSYTQVTDAGLVHLKGLNNLAALTLTNTDVTDAGLEHLIAHTGLQRLLLGNTLITEEGLAALKKTLPACQITSGRSESITKRYLEKHGASVTTQGNGWPRPIVSVQFTGSSNITDVQLGHLKGLVKLQSLGLLGAGKLTDAGLVHLKGLTNLQGLVLPKQISDAGIAELQTALPNCKIDH